MRGHVMSDYLSDILENSFLDSSRALVEIRGRDAKKFLLSLVTNDLNNEIDCLQYAALLSPQGKYLFDFFVIKKSEEFFILDIKLDVVEEFCKRLTLYKLRADVIIERTDGWVVTGQLNKPYDSFDDPRNLYLGWRKYFFKNEHFLTQLKDITQSNYQKLRVEYCIPETGIELLMDKTYILEAGFDRLNGVSFNKGCYVGQEVTARMKHKTELGKGLVRVEFSEEIEGIGAEITCNGRVVGNIYSNYKSHAIAFLKFKNLSEELISGDSLIKIIEKF